MACWDIVGKALGRPVYELLGGRVHERFRAYTYLYTEPDDAVDVYTDPDLAAERAAAYVAKGFTALKFDPVGPYSAFDPRQPSLEALAAPSATSLACARRSATAATCLSGRTVSSRRRVRLVSRDASSASTPSGSRSPSRREPRAHGGGGAGHLHPGGDGGAPRDEARVRAGPGGGGGLYLQPNLGRVGQEAAEGEDTAGMAEAYYVGDRIRMNSLAAEQVFMRSLATRRQHLATSAVLADVLNLLRYAHFDLVVVETAGIGQSDSEIVDLVDVPMYVMTSEYGAASQLEKIDMLDLAELVVLTFDPAWRLRTRCATCASSGAATCVDFTRADDEVPVYPDHREPIQRPRRQPPLRGPLRTARREGGRRQALDRHEPGPDGTGRATCAGAGDAFALPGRYRHQWPGRARRSNIAWTLCCA